MPSGFSRRSALASVLLAPLGARADGYPSRNISLIAPFAPGASADGIARIVGESLSTRLGKPVVVDNRPGAGGTAGLIALSRAEADGHTLGVGATGALVINPHVPGSAAHFDPLNELVPIAKLIDIPIVLVTRPDTGLRSVAEAIRISQERNGGLSYGTTGVNSTQHLAIELLKRATSANFTHVPYRGSAPAVTDVLGGQIPLAALDLTSADPHLRSGGLIGLAVTSRARVPFFPSIPTMAEAAGVPGFDVPAWIGLFGPAQMSPQMANRLSDEIAAVLAESTVEKRVRQLACVTDYKPANEFGDFLKTCSNQMAILVRSLGRS